jgi:hypothetical protein
MTVILKKYLYIAMMAISVAGWMTSCIDEDLSGCPPPQEDIEIVYRIVLTEQHDSGFYKTIESVHLGFWNGPSSLYSEQTLSEEELPDDMTFRFTLPLQSYSHIAMANCHDDVLGGEHLSFGDYIEDVVIEPVHNDGDTIKAMSVPFYSGTLNLSIDTHMGDTSFKVDLFPAVGKMAITVLHDEEVSDLRVCVQGTKAGFRPWGRDYIEDPDLIVLATVADFCTNNEATEKLLEFYTFPTALDDSVQVRKAPAEKDGWTLIFFGEYEGKTVRNAYTIDEQLLPGRIYRNVFQFYVDDDNVEAGVEVDVDWKPGSGHDVDI